MMEKKKPVPKKKKSTSQKRIKAKSQPRKATQKWETSSQMTVLPSRSVKKEKRMHIHRRAVDDEIVVVRQSPVKTEATL